MIKTIITLIILSLLHISLFARDKNNLKIDYLMLLNNDFKIRGNRKAVAEINKELYRLTKYQPYLKISVINYISSLNYIQAINLIDKNIKYIKNRDLKSSLKSFLIISRLSIGRITSNESIRELKKLKPKNEDVYNNIYSVYKFTKKSKLAFNISKKLYIKYKKNIYLKFMATTGENSSDLLKIIDMELNKKSITKKDKLEFLTIKLYIYTLNKNNIKYIKILKKIYQINKNPKVLQAIFSYYTKSKEVDKLLKFLKKNNLQKELLLAYRINNNYKKVISISNKIYKKSGEYKYLGIATIVEYDTSKHKGKILKKTINNLIKVNKHTNYSIFLNYLGYILIDKSINIKLGIEYVKRAIKNKSKNKLLNNLSHKEYFYDSLSWGYYKLKKCKLAKQIMKKHVIKAKGLDKTSLKIINYHMSKINKCLIK